MSTNEIVGVVMLVCIPIFISVMTIVKPIINLNTSITELNLTMKNLTKDNENINDTLESHTEQLNDHDKRLFLLENKKEGVVYGRRTTETVHRENC